MRPGSCFRRFALCVAALLALAAPAAAQAPVTIGGAGLRLLRDVPYGPDDDQRMDIYLPAEAGARPAPIILMVHGGGWRHGDKAMDRVVENKAARWVPKGIVFISVNYPMVPEADPVQQAEHVARALAAAQKAAPDWGGDPARVILMGHSAGAHLVSLLNADPARAEKLGTQPWLGTVSLDSGALDVPAIMTRKHHRLYDEAFSDDPALWQAASPIHHLTSAAKPWLGICSDMIRDSCPENRAFATQAQSLGLRAEVLPQKKRHGEINYALGEPGAYTDAVEAFLASLDPEVKALLGK